MGDNASGIISRLRSALPRARLIPFREVILTTGMPLPTKCHVNVDTWVVANPADRAIRGWLVTSGVVMDRHSVVLGEDGYMFDITPLAVQTPFFPHPGSDEEFAGLPPQIIIPPFSRDDAASYLGSGVPT
jgi:hypothetical protein